MTTPQLFSVDADGNGAGRIVSESGDVYEGSFRGWLRHGWGIQRWSSGDIFRGTWEDDHQAQGVFVDKDGKKWKGNFKTGQVERIEEPERRDQQREEAENDGQDDQQRTQQEEQKEDENSNITHFPPSAAYAYQAQYDPFNQTQPYPSDAYGGAQTSRDFSSTQYNSTQHQFPIPPHSARSGGRSRLNTAGSRRHRTQPRPQRVPFQRRRESKAEREEREKREKEEEAIVLKELKAVTHLMSNRFGSSRLPGEATFGLEHDSPGPGAYHPQLTQTKRVAPKISMAPLLPYQSEVNQIVKSTESNGPWSSNVKANNPSKPSIPSISMSRPTMLPSYVKESTFFRDVTPGPGQYDTTLSSKGTALEIAKNDGPVADHGGQSIKGHPIPLFPGYKAMRNIGLGQGADGGTYYPKYDFLANNTSSPAFSMRPRYRDKLYQELKVKDDPSPAAYSPTYVAVDPDSMGRTSGWSKSRSGKFAYPTESIRAIAYDGEKFLRGQCGLFSPGPAAYQLPTQPLIPPPQVSFSPHLIQPPAVRIAQHFIQTNHPFVEQFKQKQKQQQQLHQHQDQQSQPADEQEPSEETG